MFQDSKDHFAEAKRNFAEAKEILVEPFKETDSNRTNPEDKSN